MLTTVVLAARCKKLVAPGHEHGDAGKTPSPRTILLPWRSTVFPLSPRTAASWPQAVGSGKMPEPEVLLDHIARELAREKTLAGFG